MHNFSKTMISLTNPYADIEHINDVIAFLGIENTNVSTETTKKEVLLTIKTLLEYKILYVYEWTREIGEKEQHINNKDIIRVIDDLWIKEAKYPDLFFVFFGVQKWYVRELEKLGMSATTDWEWFVENKIGNLEKWIEENKPKE